MRILKGLRLASLVLVGAAFSLGIITSPHTAAAQTADDNEIIVTLLGTGSPALNPARFGPSTLVQAGGKDLVLMPGAA